MLAPVPPLAQLVPHVSPSIADLIDRAVAMEPEARPIATDFASALARAASQPIAGIMTPVPSPSAQTEFVASTPGFAAHAATQPGGTQFVASTPGTPAVALPPPPSQQLKRQKYALLGAIVLVIILIAVTRRAPSPPSVPATSPHRPQEPAWTAPQPSGPHTINAEQPPLHNNKAAKDWNKIVEKLHEQDFEEAREKLDEFERKHGESPETRSLAAQLDSLPEQYRRRDD